MIDLLPIYLLVLLYSGPSVGLPSGTVSEQAPFAFPSQTMALFKCRQLQAHAFRFSKDLHARCLIYEVKPMAYEADRLSKVFDTES